mmetsp:Transcript_18061/g.54869  ORF Transcript_18061/g.54869 Transcript_18061/m.54869 type:complete len:209 (+) Transcript_18061:404-1030(+)
MPPASARLLPEAFAQQSLCISRMSVGSPLRSGSRCNVTATCGTHSTALSLLATHGHTACPHMARGPARLACTRRKSSGNGSLRRHRRSCRHPAARACRRRCSARRPRSRGRRSRATPGRRSTRGAPPPPPAAPPAAAPAAPSAGVFDSSAAGTLQAVGQPSRRHRPAARCGGARGPRTASGRAGSPSASFGARPAGSRGCREALRCAS